MTAPGRPRLRILGGGGHCKVVIAIAELAGWELDGIYDDDPARWGTAVLGHQIRGPIGSAVEDASGTALFLAVGANASRAGLGGRLKGPFARLAHPMSFVHPSARYGDGTMIAAGAILHPDAAVGRHVIVNTAAVVEHDVVVGDYAHVAPGSVLAGAARVGEGAFIGAGAIVLPGRRVGAWATVGAGAVVTRDVPDHGTSVGVPNRPIGER